MSLDDIIRANKGKQRKVIAGKGTGKSPATKKGVARGIKRKPLKGVAKRKDTGPRNIAQTRRLKAGPAKAKKGVPSVSAATKKLVNKLVKKAISQTQKKQQVIRNVVVPIGRRSGGGHVRKTIVLKGVSNRSRIIGRRQRVAVLPPTVNLVRRRAPVVYNTSPAVVQIPVARRGNYRQIVYQQNPQPRVYRQAQPAGRRGGASIRDQVRAMRQQDVVYIQPQAYRSRQPRRQVYVQEQSPRGQRGHGRFQGRQNRGRRVSNKDPLIDPPNFLQRLPPAGSPARRFVYR